MKLFFVALLIFMSNAVNGQEGGGIQPLLSMDNYTVPIGKDGAIVAKIEALSGKKVKLVKDVSGLFCIKDGNILALKKGKSITKDSPISYEIEIESGGKTKTFELVKDEFVRNKVVAHRGAWKHHDVSQNSIGSLEAGIRLGCEGVEFDVQFSADNKVVLAHDPIIGGKVVEEATAAELVKIPLKNGEFIPTLEDYISIIKKQNKTHLVLELKSLKKGKERNREFADSVVNIVHRHKAQAWVEYISFDYDILLRIRALDPTARISYLENNKLPDELSAALVSGIDYYYTSFYDNANLITDAHQKGMITNAWTVNKEDDMRKLLHMGIDYITTDEPELLLKIVSGKK